MSDDCTLKEQSRAGQGRAGQGRVGQGRAGQGRIPCFIFSFHLLILGARGLV